MADFENKAKNSSSFDNQTKNSAVFTNEQETITPSSTPAKFGSAKFGKSRFSQIISGAGSGQKWTNQSKS